MQNKLDVFYSTLRHSLFVLVILLFLPLWAQQKFDVSDAPGELSKFHAESPGLKNCEKCHNEDLEVLPSKCLSCHGEIGSRISQDRGFHCDKGEDCAVCHVEHQGADAQLVPLDPEDFDHEETGAVLLGAHQTIKDCRQCHRKDNTIPRQKFWSYLFKGSGCQVCHSSPHPGNQHKCLACHSQTNWQVDIWNPGDIN
jgi:hypothetical protein